jgi:hypothetical protein
MTPTSKLTALTAERDLANVRNTFIQSKAQITERIRGTRVCGRRSERKMIMRRASALRIGMPIALVMLVACDPVVNIAGANFPAWLFCAIVGAVLAAVFRPVFAATRVEPYLGPLMLIYPCLAILLACLIYLIFFNRI